MCIRDRYMGDERSLLAELRKLSKGEKVTVFIDLRLKCKWGTKLLPLKAESKGDISWVACALKLNEIEALECYSYSYSYYLPLPLQSKDCLLYTSPSPRDS
eukprot:TRINITY_DN25995_c0_g1_i1.p1 TRINITY_DN25995_c0_g1~~TRINITY_DN25995_c0_g1_i1.p1  ORF type:complete len:115 (-),score=24.34 TRINITY_DN25995_c0_g1_i1:36-338(-)